MTGRRARAGAPPVPTATESAPAAAGPVARQTAGLGPDPRAIRVSVVAGSSALDLPAMIIGPVQEPILPASRIAGLGPLGGVAPVAEAPGGNGASADAAGPAAAAEAPAPRFAVDGAPSNVSLDALDAERAVLRSGGSTVRVLLLAPPAGPNRLGVERREVVVDGWRIELEVESAARAALRERASRGRAELTQAGPTEVRAIIPGVVVGVSVVPGDAVAAGQQLLVVEAMKMQNELRAPREGTIERVAVAPGETIEVGDLLLVIA